MDTESPAQRLTRRIGTDRDAVTEVPEEESDTVLARWLPDGDRPSARDWLGTLRADPGRAGVIALLGVGIIAVLVTVFTVLRDSPAPVSSANLPAVQMVSGSPTAQAGATAGPPEPPDGPVVVSVVGLVNTPGLVTLTAGDRIADALEAAGGAVDGADLVGLNLARRVADGEQIIVGLAAPPGSPSPMGSSVSSAAPPEQAPPARPNATATPGAPVNLNTATPEDLDALPGVGPVTAAAIIAWREANGRFTSIDQLSEVDGIGPARLDKLRGLVDV
ncbi:helix-hairpin-helix domain-containing protein [Mycolicibacterium frederiksbergense]|uniref:helix-hairpin-helix domain-containing protein n=1 Tax=Mycolicibacterium frederiksbergense TaxID=117567 RepID=UPI00399B8DE4